MRGAVVFLLAVAFLAPSGIAQRSNQRTRENHPKLALLGKKIAVAFSSIGFTLLQGARNERMRTATFAFPGVKRLGPPDAPRPFQMGLSTGCVTAIVRSSVGVREAVLRCAPPIE